MLIAIVGRYENVLAGSIRGNGKTISAVYLAYLDYLNGRKIYTNFKTTFSETYKINDLLTLFKDEKLEDVTVIIDEAQIYLNNCGVKVAVRREIIQKFIAQSRKSNIDIIVTTQRFLQLHKELREQTDIILVSIKYHYDKENNKILEICGRDNCKKDHVIRIVSLNKNPVDYIRDENNKIITLNPEIIGQMYNTNEIVLDNFEIQKPEKKKNGLIN
jgi:hypothetical protein